MDSQLPLTDRRFFLGHFAGLGLGGTLFPGVLWAHIKAGAEVTDASIIAAAEIAGMTFTDDERKQMLAGIKNQPALITQLRAVPLENAVSPAMVFNPLPANAVLPTGPYKPPVRPRVTAPAVPGPREALADHSVPVPTQLITRRTATTEALPQMNLAPLDRLTPPLHNHTTSHPPRP